MMERYWYAILESRELGNKPIGVTRLGQRLVLWRTASGEPACVAERCAHRGAALSLGSVRGEHIACPFHGFEFDSTGSCRLIPASGRNAKIPQAMRQRAFPVREAHGLIFLWFGEVPHTLPPLPWFDDLTGHGEPTLRQEWPVHYTRAIENQLDIPHVPFVHKSTIGRGVAPVVDGPAARLESDKLDIWFTYRPDDGKEAASPQELKPEGPAMITFQFPNLWHFHLAPKRSQFIAFAPVDDERTVLYVRSYQRMVGAPGLRWLFNALSMVFNAVVLGQDRGVVVTQRPLASELRGGEKLVSSDWPIALFRRRRAERLAVRDSELPTPSVQATSD
ncbi:MAG TPA: aromatic ring-hydroxylating dioxygenase subunit alpha [Anaeromyxobacter sp.]|nr:aromatic ring-hydroxylating dioxygenase subunit alpha [Anaeromyxobacter sp.]